MRNQPIIVPYFALIYAASSLQVSARDNIARTGFAKQSSTINYGTPKRFLWNASLAIDGNKSERTRVNGKPTCSATNQQNNLWWRVDLHTDRKIERIRVFGRVGTHPEQLRGFRMYVTSSDSDMIPDEDLIYADNVTVKQYNFQSAVYDINTTHKGRFVYIVLEKDKALLVLCEVEVYGECLDGNYGQNCINKCGHCWNNDPCDKVTGTCTTCAPGYEGLNCFAECLNGNYGQNCSSKCGHCRNNNPCDKLNGACTSCAPGYNGLYCFEECQDGWFGEDCNSTCGHCYETEVCDKKNGLCSACADGYRGALCIEVECQDGWFGEDCNSKCGHCNGTEVCDKEDGHCSACADGYRGAFCIEVCTNYTYGVNCLHSCGNCRDGLTCNHKTGLCLACADGYRNNDKLCITECEFGFYGDGCRLECGLCSGNQTCQSDTGECLDGCKRGWQGSLCQSRQPKSDIPLKEIFIYGGVGVAVFVSLAFVTSCVCLYKRKKKRRRQVKQELILYAKAIESEPIPPYEEPPEEEEPCYAVGNLNEQSSGYEYLMRDAINVEVAHFPDIYKKLLSIWQDGKTVLYYGFQSLQTTDPMYEWIDEDRRDILDITTLTYKELLCRYQSSSEIEKFNFIQGSTYLLQMDTLSVFLSDDVFSRETFWQAIERHKITTCIQIGKPSISVNDRFTIGCFNIECTSWDKNDFDSELNIIVSSNISGSLTRFKLINCRIWQDWMDVPIDLLWIITMIAHLSNVLDEGARVIIHCEQHINKAALIAVMSDILIKMENQCHVDILGPIQTARRTIPTAISTYEQFKFLHDVVLLAIQKTCFITEAPHGLDRTRIPTHSQSEVRPDASSYSKCTSPSLADTSPGMSFTNIAKPSTPEPSHGYSSVVMPSLAEAPQQRSCIQRILPSSFEFPQDRAVTQISGPSFSENPQNKSYTSTTPSLTSAPQGWSYTQMNMPPLSDAPYDMSYTKMNKPSLSEEPHDASNTQMITYSLSEVSQGYTKIVMPPTSGASRTNSYMQMTNSSSSEAFQNCCYTHMNLSMPPD